jgi:mono/diheme cytochrome c family protein
MTTPRIAAVGLFFALSALAQKDAKDTYLDKCSVCHGADGAGKTAKGRKLKVKDVHETAAKMSAADMIKIVESGKGTDMDAYGKDLSKDQITAVVDYYRSLGK